MVGHKLQPNHRTTFPSHMIFVDTETLPVTDGDWERHKLRLGVAKYWRRSDSGDTFENIRFTTPVQFWDWALSKAYYKTKLYIISHNQDFDFRTLLGFEVMASRGWALDYAIIQSPPYILQYSYDGGKVKGKKKVIIQDTTNYFMMKLEKIGDILGVPKLPMPDFKASDKVWWPYCEQDTEVLYQLWKQFLEFIMTNDLGNFGVTVASQALNAFKHRFMKHDIWIHGNERVSELEREGYFGGRTEVFRKFTDTDNTYYYIDVNSMYPSVMLNNLYPVRYNCMLTDVPPNALEGALDEGLYMGRVLVETDVPCIPKRLNQRLCFPVGRFWTTLATPELRLAYQYGRIMKVDLLTCYKGEQIFTDYITELYGLRKHFKQTKEAHFDLFTKYLLNSLYGKFGQYNEQWKPTDKEISDTNGIYMVYDVEENRLITYRVIEGTTFEQQGHRSSHHSFHAISAHVTSYARVVMWSAFKQVGKGNYVYCDTDSMILTEAGYSNMKDSLNDTELGKWSLEKTVKSISVHNLKDYVLDGKITLKGVPKDQRKERKEVYNVTVWEHTLGALRKGYLGEPRTREGSKSLHGGYLKGNIGSEGWVEPYHLKEELEWKQE